MDQFLRQRRLENLLEKFIVGYYALWLVLLFVGGVVLSGVAEAGDSLILRGGPAIVDGSPSGSAKIFGVRDETYHAGGIYSAVEFGGWVDKTPGNMSSQYLKAQVGTAPGPRVGLFAKAFIGPAFISNPDNLLGGHFQFAEDFGIGIRDRHTSVSVCYTHFSSAGLSTPNVGRDWITFEIGYIW